MVVRAAPCLYDLACRGSMAKAEMTIADGFAIHEDDI
jgi:hypothetical protein